MPENKSSGLLTIMQNLIFKNIGEKLKPGSLRRLNALLFVIFEKIAINFDIFIYDYLDIYKGLVRDEIKLANISSNDSILVVGCGAVPSSCILLANETNAKITGIDIDKKAVKKASNLIKKLKLEEKIKVEWGDGTDYPVKGYNIILILFGVKSVNKIFGHLSEHMENNTKIILRSTISFNPEKNKDFLNISKFFKQEKKLLSKSFGSLSLYLFKKSN